MLLLPEDTGILSSLLKKRRQWQNARHCGIHKESLLAIQVCILKLHVEYAMIFGSAETLMTSSLISKHVDFFWDTVTDSFPWLDKLISLGSYKHPHI